MSLRKLGQGLLFLIGAAVGGLAMAGSDAVGIFAAIGGMTLGLLWFARALFMKRAE